MYLGMRRMRSKHILTKFLLEFYINVYTTINRFLIFFIAGDICRFTTSYVCSMNKPTSSLHCSCVIDINQ